MKINSIRHVYCFPISDDFDHKIRVVDYGAYLDFPVAGMWAKEGETIEYHYKFFERDNNQKTHMFLANSLKKSGLREVK